MFSKTFVICGVSFLDLLRHLAFNQMIVTINTDASFHPQYKVGAYAFWIVCNQGKIVQSGALKKGKDSNDCEIQCIGNALYSVLMSNFTDVKYIIINTDNKYAIEALRDKVKRRIKANPSACKMIDSIIGKLRRKYDIGPRKHRAKPFIDWRYVPAHTLGEDKRTWVNNECDRLAKKALWDSINSTKK